MSHSGLSPIHEGGIDDLVKVLPDLQANIRRFLAVRKYESLKLEKKKTEAKERKEQQKTRMLSLSKPRGGPAPPKVLSGKSASHTSPAMQQRLKKPSSRTSISSAEFQKKYQRTALKTPALPENVVPVEKFDRDMTELMKNINEITLTLNMHDASILPTTAKKSRRGGGVEAVAYLGLSHVPFPEVLGPDTGKLQRSPPKVSVATASSTNSPQEIYSERVRAVLANIEAEYATLAKTNEQIKEAITTATGDRASTKPSLALTESSSHGGSTNNSPGKSQLTLQALSPNKPLSTVHDSDTRGNFSVSGATHTSSDSGSYTYNSSLVTVDSDAYIPIRRSGDARLDVLVQETLMRAQNSIREPATIEEHRAYEGDELQNMLHKVVIQLNDSCTDPGDVLRRASSGSQTSTDSVGLDALTRSITAIQAHNKSAQDTPTTSSQLTSHHPSAFNSENNSSSVSHENSMDSHQSGSTNESDQTTVSELTIAIQDILANLSGGIFERAKLEFSAADLESHNAVSPARSVVGKSVHSGSRSSVAMAGGGEAHDDGTDHVIGRIGDTIMAQVRSEMHAPVGQTTVGHSSSADMLRTTPPLEMSDYLESVYARNQAYVATQSSTIGASSSSGKGVGGIARNVLTSLDYMEHPGTEGEASEQDKEKADLYLLLQHQERSMQLIRASIQAIERGVGLGGASAVIGVSGGAQGELVSVDEEVDAGPSADSPSPRKSKSARGKHRKKAKQQAPRNAAELDMLRNLQQHLRREKEQVTANKNLSYDELMLKARSDMGVHGDTVEPKPRKGLRDHRRSAEEEDAYHRHLQNKFLKEKASGSVGVGKKLYPITDADGEDEDDTERTIAPKLHTESQQRLYARRLALEREIEEYNRSHRVPLPSHADRTHSGSSSEHDSPRDEVFSSSGAASALQGHVEYTSPSRSQNSRHEPFNMSEALLSSPGLSSGEKAGKKKLKFSDVPVGYSSQQEYYHSHSGKDYEEGRAQGKSHASLRSHASGSKVSTDGGSVDGEKTGWNVRFHSKDGDRTSNIQGFGLRNDVLRASAEDSYEAKRLMKQKEKEAELHEYRHGFNTRNAAVDHHDVEEQSRTREGDPSPKKKRSGKGSKGKRRGDGEFDEKFISAVEMLNIKAPTAIKSSVAAAEASPRRNLAKLLHPFK